MLTVCGVMSLVEVVHSSVFSAALFFSVQISGDLPVLAKPDPSAALAPLPILSPAAAVAINSSNMAVQNAKPPLPANSIRVWLRCPEELPHKEPGALY